MTTLTFDQQYKFKNTHFKNFKDFFDFAIDNQLIGEFGEIYKNEIDKKTLNEIKKAKELPDSYFVNLETMLNII